MGEEMESQAVLETGKVSMLTELEHGTIFVDKTLVEDVAGFAIFSEEVHKIMQQDGSVRSSLKIEVIDDTALIESVPLPKTGNGCLKDIESEGTAKKMRWKGKREEKKKEVDRKKVKQSRRKAKDSKRVLGMTERLKDGGLKNGEESRKMYSKQEMEALRFVDIVEQRKLWRAIYTELGAVVSNEYDELTNSKRKNTLLNFDPQQRFPMKLEAPGILGVITARGKRNQFNIFVH